MTIHEIPTFILQSGVLSSAELSLLASINGLPSEEEIDAFQYEPEIQELLNAFIGDETARQTHQLLKAKEFLKQHEIAKAWKIALL